MNKNDSVTFMDRDVTIDTYQCIEKSYCLCLQFDNTTLVDLPGTSYRTVYTVSRFYL